MDKPLRVGKFTGTVISLILGRNPVLTDVLGRE